MMDYDGSGGVSEFKGFTHGGLRRERGSEIRRDGITRADDIYLPVNWIGQDVVGFAVGGCSKDAWFGQSDEDQAAIASGKVHGSFGDRGNAGGAQPGGCGEL